MADKSNSADRDQEFLEMQEMYHQVLHELADAVQIIRSYEFLQQAYSNESDALRDIADMADDLCTARNFTSFIRKRAILKQALADYQAKAQAENGADYCEFAAVNPRWFPRKHTMSVN